MSPNALVCRNQKMKIFSFFYNLKFFTICNFYYDIITTYLLKYSKILHNLNTSVHLLLS